MLIHTQERVDDMCWSHRVYTQNIIANNKNSSGIISLVPSTAAVVYGRTGGFIILVVLHVIILCYGPRRSARVSFSVFNNNNNMEIRQCVHQTAGPGIGTKTDKILLK